MSKTAVITGATSGIGAAYARRLAAQGYDLILTGRRQAIIQKLADELAKTHKINVNVIIAELSDDKDIQKVIDAVQAAEDVEILINNAGYSIPSRCFGDGNNAECEAMVKVLTIVPMRLVNAVLPGMRQKRSGAIINVSSVAGLFPIPNTSIYAASKAFLKSFSESLYMELRGEGIKVQAVCPGVIDTDFYRNLAKEKKGLSGRFKKMTPEQVVDSSLKYLKANRSICLPGASYKVLNALFTSLPRPALYAFMGRSIRRIEE